VNNNSNAGLIAQPNANPYAINLELAKEQVTEFTASTTKKVTIVRKAPVVETKSFGFVPRRYQPKLYNMKNTLMNEYRGTTPKAKVLLASSVLWNNRSTPGNKPSYNWRRQCQPLGSTSRRTLQPLPLPEPPKLKTCSLDDQNPPDFVPFKEEEKTHQLKLTTGGYEDKTTGVNEVRSIKASESTVIQNPNLVGKAVPTLGTEDANPPVVKFKGDPTPKLLNPEIRTVPEFKDLQQMTERQLASVPDFEIEHVQYGQIKWDDPVDLRGVQLDDIVRFSQSAFELYPDIDTKPEFGIGFMRPCSVMLYNVWPKGCSSMRRPSFKREERWRASLEKYCNSCNYKFIEYDTNGLLEFSVNHEHMNPVVEYEKF